VPTPVHVIRALKGSGGGWVHYEQAVKAPTQYTSYGAPAKCRAAPASVRSAPPVQGRELKLESKLENCIS